MRYNPSHAASCIKSQGSAGSPHGAGGKPPKPADSIRGGGMGYSPSKAASVVDRAAPANGGKSR